MSRSRRLAVRVDVDTHAGMRDGVPRLLEVFASAGVRASFYLSMGPDRSGRAVFNVFRPGFLTKMRRTSAARVYGLRTVLSGTLLPARPIASAFPAVARRIRDEGHETGVHAWDHRTWQDRLFRMSPRAIADQLDRGRAAYAAIFGRPPTTYAAPAWLTCDEALRHQDGLSLEFGTDCRGREPFVPVVGGRRLTTPQVPATLPTLDELLGSDYDTADAYFDGMLDRLGGERWPVLTVHAEIEGGPYADAFLGFLERGVAAGVRFVTLGRMLAERRAEGPLPSCAMVHAPVAGRHGVVSTQGAAAVTA